MSTDMNVVHEIAAKDYEWGFVTEIEEDRIPKGLSEDVIRLISAKKQEPEFMLDWRLNAYRYWVSQEKADAEPKWANVTFPPINYQGITYYSAPKHLREAGDSAGGAEAAGQRRGGRGIRLGERGDDV